MTSGQCNSWFENCGEVFGGWRLDVVSLLAVIGEAIVADQAQVISSSKLSLLPRLIPAPQAFLRAERPRKLPAVPGVVVKSILGGSQVNELNYFANVLHDIDKLPNYAVQECEISLRNAALPGKPTVAQKMWSPHNVLAVASCMITLGLFATACALGDGIAALAIAVLALQSSLGCAAWRWKPILMARVAGSSKEVPEGHVAIRTRGGGFVIIKCVEEVARLLYIGEDIAQYYLGPTQAKIATGVATAFLMFGVVLLGNAHWIMQAAIGGTFIALNGAYWGVALYSRERCWELDELFLIVKKKPIAEKQFTKCLWSVIKITQETKWLKDSGALPQSAAWDEWLQEAEENKKRDPDWDAVGRMLYHVNPKQQPV